MNSAELTTLAHVMQAIAAGAEWECEWDDGWGNPSGRDLEFCIGKRIPVRIKGEVPSANGGSPAAHISLRQYAAIELRVPNSGIEWLDDMIRQSRLDHNAGQALTGILSNPCLIELHEDYLLAARAAYNFAAAMPAASKGKETK